MLVIMYNLVRVDQVDVSGCVYDEVYLRAQIRVVLLSHTHVDQSNITRRTKTIGIVPLKF